MPTLVQTFLNPIFPIFAIMLLGIVLGRKKIFNYGDAQIINRFVFYAAVPPLIFYLTLSAPLKQLNPTVIALYLLSEVTVFSVTAFLARVWLKRSMAESILLGMASNFVNHVFFILPIVTVLYGDQGVLPVSAIIAIDTVIVFCGMIIGFEIASHRGESYLKAVISVVRNPILVAMALGIMVNLVGLELHAGIHTFITFAGKAAAPAALFSLGIIVAEVNITRPDSAAMLVTAMKIIVHPLLLLLLFTWIGSLEVTWSKTLLLTAAGPCGAMPFVLALQYKVKADSIGVAIVYSTLASLITLSILG